MRFLVDNALSPLVGAGLRDLGHDAVHVREVGLAAASDGDILAFAAQESRVIVSADTDFAALIALRKLSSPSFILFRGGLAERAIDQVRLLGRNLSSLEAPLSDGCIAVFEAHVIRVRKLPITNDD